jgi:hypothetical protein
MGFRSRSAPEADGRVISAWLLVDAHPTHAAMIASAIGDSHRTAGRDRFMKSCLHRIS